MKNKWNWLVVLLCFIAFLTSCSVDKNLVKNEKIIDEKERFSDPEITYNAETSYTKQNIIIDLKKIETIKKEKVITKQYHNIEHRTLRLAKREDDTFASFASSDGCCVILFLPFWLIHVPYKMIESIDKDYGSYNKNNVQIMDVLEKPLEINDGYIILEEENLKIPVAHNKVLINLNQLRLNQESYIFELYEGGIAKKRFTLLSPLLQTKLDKYDSKSLNTIKEINNAIESLEKLKKDNHDDIVLLIDEKINVLKSKLAPLIQSELDKYNPMKLSYSYNKSNTIEAIDDSIKYLNGLKQNQTGEIISSIDGTIRDLESRRNILLREVAERPTIENLVKNLIDGYGLNMGIRFEKGDVLSIPLGFLKAIDLSQEDGLYIYLVMINDNSGQLKPFYIQTDRPFSFYYGQNMVPSIKIKYKGNAKYLQNRVQEKDTLLFEEI